MKNGSTFFKILLAFVLVLPVAVSAQNVTISGHISDADGEALPGAAIAIQSARGDRQGGTAADINGYFTLSVLPTDTIAVSYLGYETQTLLVGNRTRFDISLKSQLTSVGQVVVTGYQTISKERATGSFAKIDEGVLSKQRLNDINSLLDGQVAGLTDGLVRGTTTMQGTKAPLYVVDGFPIENMAFSSSPWYSGAIGEGVPDLNLEDIESITVLKDAAAASIYGARAANGIIVIETKKTKAGKIDISASVNVTFQPYSYYTGNLATSSDIIGLEKEWAASNPNFTGSNSASYAQTLLDDAIYITPGTNAIIRRYAGEISESEMNSILNNYASKGFNYYKDMEKYAKRNYLQQQYNLTVGHGTEKNSFRSSITFKDTKLNDKYSRDGSVGINITDRLKLTKWLEIDMGTFNQYGKTTDQTFNVLSPGYTVLPYMRLVNDDGSYFTSTAEMRFSKTNLGIIDTYDLYNMDITPLDEIRMNHGKTKSFSNRTYLRANVRFTDWLNYTAQFQYEHGSDKYDQLRDKNSYTVRNMVNRYATYTADGGFNYLLPYGNIYDRVDYFTNAYNFRQQLNFDRTFADVHNIVAIAGFEIRQTKYEYRTSVLYNYDPQSLTYSYIDASNLSNPTGTVLGGYYLSTQDIARQMESEDRYVSIYGNAAYTYNNKYMVSGSVRWDRSNLWGTGSEYQDKPIWSFGAGWNIDREEFFDVPQIDRLKLRVSYGIGGNIAKNVAPYLTAYYYSNNTIGGNYGVISNRPNPLLTWEKTKTFDAGIDFSVLGARLHGSFDFYDKKGVDLLANAMGVPTEGFGYSTYAMNNGEMYNRGVELTLNGSVVKTRDFSFDMGLVYGYNKNKVTHVTAEAPVAYIFLDYSSQYPRVGDPYTGIYGYRWAGLNENGEPQIYQWVTTDEDGNEVPRYLKETNVNPNDLDDIVYLGTTSPKHSGSFNLNFRYKNLELYTMFTFRTGHKVRDTNLPYLTSSYAGGSYRTMVGAVNERIADRWRAEGDESHTNVPRVVWGEEGIYNSSSEGLYRYSSINVLNASHMKLTNLTLTYHIPAEWTKKAFVQSARVQFNVQNLWTVAKSKEAKVMLNGFDKPYYTWTLNINF